MTEHFHVPEDKEPTHDEIVVHLCSLYDDFSKKLPKDADYARDKWINRHYTQYREHLRARRAEPLPTVSYDVNILDCADLMTVEEWIECCEMGGFVDDDGHGHPVKAQYIELKDGMNPAEYPTTRFLESSMPISPSNRHLLPRDATHVAWYNR